MTPHILHLTCHSNGRGDFIKFRQMKESLLFENPKSPDAVPVSEKDLGTIMKASIKNIDLIFICSPDPEFTGKLLMKANT